MPLHVFPNLGDKSYCVISENPVFGVFNTTEDGLEEEALGVRWEDIPKLITDLRRAYNEHAANTPTS